MEAALAADLITVFFGNLARPKIAKISDSVCMYQNDVDQDLCQLALSLPVQVSAAHLPHQVHDRVGSAKLLNVQKAYVQNVTVLSCYCQLLL